MKGFVFCLSLAAATVCMASEPATRGWSARYRDLCQTFEKKDRKALAGVFAPDLVWIQVDGTKKNRNETLADFESMFAADTVKAHEKLLSVRRRGNLVDVRCEVFVKMTSAGKTDARMHSFCTDTWKRLAGKWVMVKTVDHKVEMTGGQ